MGPALLIAVFAHIALYLSPVLSSGYYSDDRTFEITTGGLFRMNEPRPLMRIVLQDTKNTSSAFRFTPLSFLIIRTVFRYLDNVVVYKSYLLFMTMFSILLFYLFIRNLSRNRTLAIIAVLILPVFFQLRVQHHEPLAAFHGLMQTILILLLLSFICLQLYLERPRPGLLVLSVLFYWLTLLAYEISYLFIAVHFQLIWNRKRNILGSLKLIMPFCLGLAVTVGIMVFLAFSASGVSTYGGTTLNLRPDCVIFALAKQLAATLPFIYVLRTQRLDLLWGLRDLPECRNMDFLAASVFFGAAATHVIMLVLSGKEERHTPVVRSVVATGILFMVLPALPIAVSSKYQAELKFGLGHIPVFIQYFGLALICSTVLKERTAAMKASRKLIVLYILFFALIYITGAANFYNNKKGIRQANRYHYPNHILRLSLAAGMFDDIPEDTTVIFDEQYLYAAFDYRYIFYEYLGRNIRCVDGNDYRKSIAQQPEGGVNDVGKNLYVLRFPKADRMKCRVKVGKVSRTISHGPGKEPEIYVSEARFFRGNIYGHRDMYFRSGDSFDVVPLMDIKHAQNGRYEWFSVQFPESGADWASLRTL